MRFTASYDDKGIQCSYTSRVYFLDLRCSSTALQSPASQPVKWGKNDGLCTAWAGHMWQSVLWAEKILNTSILFPSWKLLLVPGWSHPFKCRDAPPCRTWGWGSPRTPKKAVLQCVMSSGDQHLIYWTRNILAIVHTLQFCTMWLPCGIELTIINTIRGLLGVHL